MEELDLNEDLQEVSVPICKRPGCGKAACPGKAYCSAECAPQGQYFSGRQDEATPEKMEFVERDCAQNCGKTFRVLSTSSQRYCSSLCQSLAAGTDPFKGQDWHGKDATTKEAKRMPKTGKTAANAAELARALGIENYKIYHAIKMGRIKKYDDGFDIAEAREAFAGKATRKTRTPRGNGKAAALVTPIRPELVAVEADSTQVHTLEQIRRKAFDAAIAKFRAVLLEESDRIEQAGDLRLQNQLLKECIRAETRFQRCFDPEAA